MVMTRGDLVKKLLGVRNVKSLVVLLPQGLGWEDEIVLEDKEGKHWDLVGVRDEGEILALVPGELADCCVEDIHDR